MASAVLRSRLVQLLIAGTLMVSSVFGAAFIVLHRTSRPARPGGRETGSPAHRRAEPGAGASHRPAIRRGGPPAGSQRELSADALPRGGRTDLPGSPLPQLRSPTIRETPSTSARSRATSTAAAGGRSSTRASPGWEDAEQRRSRGGALPPSRRSGPRVLQIYGECRDVADHRMDHIGFVDVSRELTSGRP